MDVVDQLLICICTKSPDQKQSIGVAMQKEIKRNNDYSVAY